MTRTQPQALALSLALRTRTNPKPSKLDLQMLKAHYAGCGVPMFHQLFPHAVTWRVCASVCMCARVCVRTVCPFVCVCIHLLSSYIINIINNIIAHAHTHAHAGQQEASLDRSEPPRHNRRPHEVSPLWRSAHSLARFHERQGRRFRHYPRHCEVQDGKIEGTSILVHVSACDWRINW